MYCIIYHYISCIHISGWWFGTCFMTFHIFGMSSSQQTKSIIFQRGRSTTNQIYIWVNYNDLTATSLESWLIRGIIPKWPYFRVVNYYNLPRYMYTGLFLLMSRCFPDLHHDPPPTRVAFSSRQAMDSGYPIIPTFHGSNAQTHGSTVQHLPGGKAGKLLPKDAETDWVILPLCPEMPWFFCCHSTWKSWKCSKDAPETLWVNSQIDIKFFHCKCHHSSHRKSVSQLRNYSSILQRGLLIPGRPWANVGNLGRVIQTNSWGSLDLPKICSGVFFFKPFE